MPKNNDNTSAAASHDDKKVADSRSIQQAMKLDDVSARLTFKVDHIFYLNFIYTKSTENSGIACHVNSFDVQILECTNNEEEKKFSKPHGNCIDDLMGVSGDDDLQIQLRNKFKERYLNKGQIIKYINNDFYSRAPGYIVIGNVLIEYVNGRKGATNMACYHLSNINAPMFTVDTEKYPTLHSADIFPIDLGDLSLYVATNFNFSEDIFKIPNSTKHELRMNYAQCILLAAQSETFSNEKTLQFTLLHNIIHPNEEKRWIRYLEEEWKRQYMDQKSGQVPLRFYNHCVLIDIPILEGASENTSNKIY